ncbi:MAG: hypothetical protein ACRD3I_02175, partial [Terriglobales bacterium]
MDEHQEQDSGEPLNAPPGLARRLVRGSGPPTTVIMTPEALARKRAWAKERDDGFAARLAEIEAQRNVLLEGQKADLEATDKRRAQINEEVTVLLDTDKTAREGMVLLEAMVKSLADQMQQARGKL